jgi:PAS domain S-box-containing protein
MENKNSSWNILMVDDDEEDYLLTRAMLSEIDKHSVHLEWAPDYKEALIKLSSIDWDAVLIDYDLGISNGIQLIRDAISNGVTSPLVMVTGRGRYEVDIEAMQAGACDYVTKAELTSALLERIVRYAINQQHTEQILEQRVQERTEALQTAMEELQVMEEELRVQLEETLHSQEEREAFYRRYWDLYEFAPKAYIVTDPIGVVLDANQAAVHLFNRPKQSLLGKPLSIFIAEDDRPDFRGKLARLFQTQDIEGWDISLRPINSDTVLVHAVVSPLRGSDGKIISIRWLIDEKKVKEKA